MLSPCPVAFSCRITKSEHGKYKVLYNSQLLFQHRLYADLETILYHVHLFKPLSQLMKHAALYIRTSVPQKAFQALTRCAPQTATGIGVQPALWWTRLAAECPLEVQFLLFFMPKEADPGVECSFKRPQAWIIPAIPHVLPREYEKHIGKMKTVCSNTSHDFIFCTWGIS